MKKNFFKKLSFVMALAMLISVIAPAAGAFAATAPKLNSAKKYLFLSGVSGPSEFDFNVKNKQTGWKYAWSSANESVATVDSVGLTTAEGIGSTVVSVKITKSGKTVATLKADVIVKDNIETVTISNAPTTDLNVDKEYDFNRSFVTESGSTTKTTSVTKWTVDKETATISSTGVFKATAAGEYTVTALAFQSSAKYEAYVASKDASLVLDTDEVKVNVVASVVSTKQVDSDTFTVTFDSDMSKTDLSKSTAVLYQVIGGKDTTTGAEKIKALTLDSTGKVATVDLYAAVNEDTVYKFAYGKLTGSFTSAKKSLANITGILFSDFTTNVTTGAGQDMEAKITAVNKDGVAIYTGSEISTSLSFTYGGDLTKGYVAGKMAYIYTDGYSASVTAKFETYIYNDTTKTYDKVTYTAVANAKGVKPDTSLNTTTMQYAVGASQPASDSTAWGASVSIPAKETTNVYTRFKNNDPSATNGLSNYTTTPGRFTYTSSNTDIILIGSNDTIYAITKGTATIIVKDTTNNNAIVGTFDVVVVDERAFASAIADTASVTIGNNATNGETANIKIVTKDTVGTAFNPTINNSDISFVNSPAGANTALVTFSQTLNSDKSLTLGVSAKGAKAGAYNVKLQVGGLGSTKKDVYVTVIVVEANTAATTGVAVWKVELSKSSVDLKDVNDAVAVNIDVYGYNSANVRVAKLTSSDYTVTVKKGDTTVSTNNTAFDVVTKSGTALTVANGPETYVVTASVSGSAITGRVSGSYIGATSLTVADTTTKVAVTDTTIVSGGALSAAVKEAFTFNYNGTSVETMNNMVLTKVTYSKGATALVSTDTTIASGESVYVSEVEWTKTNDNGNTVVYKFTVNTTIKGK